MSGKREDFKDWILFEDEDLIVLNKPPYIPSLAERGRVTAVPVFDRVKEYDPEARLAHRLDRETSGLLLVARNSEMYRHLSILLEKRKVKKVYHAVVHGQVNFQELEVDLPINTDVLAKIHIDRKTGKRATTVFNTLENFRHFSLVECRPITGRLHQIRVHLASQHAPVAADLMYGGKLSYLAEIKKRFSGEIEKPLIPRFALHAHSIEFEDMQGKTRYYEAPYPKDLTVFLKQLRTYDKL